MAKRVFLVLVLLVIAAVGVPADDDCEWNCSPGNWDPNYWSCDGYYWAASCENCWYRCPGGGGSGPPPDVPN